MTGRDDPPIFWAVVDDLRRGGHRHHWRRTWFSPRDDRDVAAPPSETRPLITSPVHVPRGAAMDPDPTAATAGEENHEDPWVFASDDPADAPTDTGRPADGDA